MTVIEFGKQNQDTVLLLHGGGLSWWNYREVAEMLSECGVNDILLSVDAFHQETIPLDYVKIFAENVVNNNLQIRVHPAWLVSPDVNNIYNNITKDLLKEFTGMGINISNGNIIFPSGNAIKYFPEYFDLGKTEQNPYWEDPTDIKAICFSANGDILGSNIYKQNINEILSSYNPKG